MPNSKPDWFKNDEQAINDAESETVGVPENRQLIQTDGKFEFSSNGRSHRLTIRNATSDDVHGYTVTFAKQKSKVTLSTDGNSLQLTG